MPASRAAMRIVGAPVSESPSTVPQTPVLVKRPSHQRALFGVELSPNQGTALMFPGPGQLSASLTPIRNSCP